MEEYRSVREDIGTYESDPEINKKIREHFAKQQGIDLSMLEKAVKIVLPRFPELGSGERILVGEIKQRLSEVRRTGYPIEPYSNLNAEETWVYLNSLKSEITGKAKEFCPELLREIRRRNSNAVRQAKGFR